VNRFNKFIQFDKLINPAFLKDFIIDKITEFEISRLTIERAKKISN